MALWDAVGCEEQHTDEQLVSFLTKSGGVQSPEAKNGDAQNDTIKHIQNGEKRVQEKL